jgi:hypothetical protein
MLDVTIVCRNFMLFPIYFCGFIKNVWCENLNKRGQFLQLVSFFVFIVIFIPALLKRCSAKFD